MSLATGGIPDFAKSMLIDFGVDEQEIETADIYGKQNRK